MLIDHAVCVWMRPSETACLAWLVHVFSTPTSQSSSKKFAVEGWAIAQMGTQAQVGIISDAAPRPPLPAPQDSLGAPHPFYALNSVFIPTTRAYVSGCHIQGFRRGHERIHTDHSPCS